MTASLITGVILGLSAGFSPGPLLTFVISQTLRHGIREGVKAALSPLITDLPIILMTAYVLTRLTNSRSVLGLISLVGGSFVVYLAYESFRTNRLDLNIQNAAPQSLSRGAVVNALNPHPYLFWSSVGAPTVIKAWATNPFVAVAFLVGFYVCLVGSKISVVMLVGKSRQLFLGKTYGYVMRVLGVLLFTFALLLFRDGLELIGLVH